MNGSAATARVLVLDACRSASLTRIKGGRAGPSFSIKIDDRLGAEGVAILTSSAAGEDSQESDRLKASFFTHYLASALLRAADQDRDGLVTLSEAFQYSSEHTLRATSTTHAGPQHPTYRYAIGGREELVLTRPRDAGVRFGALEFHRPGTYLVQENSIDGKPVDEVRVDGKARSVALRPGRYMVSQRKPAYLLQGSFVTRARESTSVEPSEMERIAYARVVRKGGAEIQSVYSLVSLVGARGSILSLGHAPGGELGFRVDRKELSMELRVGLAASEHENDHLRVRSWESTASLGAMRVFDLGSLALGVGIEAGGLWLAQSFANSPQTSARNALGLFLAPTSQLQWALHGPWYARMDASAVTYFIRASKSEADGGLQFPVSWRGGLGIGRFF